MRPVSSFAENLHVNFRRCMSGKVNSNHIGYFAGDEPPFTQLYRAYLAVNAKVEEDLKQKKAAEPK